MGTTDGPQPATGDRTALKIICWNINGLAETLKNIKHAHSSLEAWFDKLGADVVCLQETKLSLNAVTREMACPQGWESFWASSGRGYSGCATFLRVPRFQATHAELDEGLSEEEDLAAEGRFILTDLGHLVIINVYAPNAGDRDKGRPRLAFKLRWFAALRTKLCTLAAEGRDVILVGDLNISAQRCDVHPQMNFDGMYCQEELDIMADLTTRFPDVWRVRHPHATDGFSMWEERTNARDFNYGLRLDYALVTPGLLPRAECEILLDMPRKWSDHAALRVTIEGVPSRDAARPHRPCALSSVRDKRFNDPLQGDLRRLFGAARGAAPARRNAVPACDVASTAHGAGSTEQPTPTKQSGHGTSGGPQPEARPAANVPPEAVPDVRCGTDGDFDPLLPRAGNAAAGSEAGSKDASGPQLAGNEADCKDASGSQQVVTAGVESDVSVPVPRSSASTSAVAARGDAVKGGGAQKRGIGTGASASAAKKHAGKGAPASKSSKQPSIMAFIKRPAAHDQT